MSVQPVDHHDSGAARTPNVAPTIEAISGALGSQALRLQFYTETLSAPAGAEISEVLERWRAEAMLDVSGNRERRHSASRTSFDELTAPLGGADALCLRRPALAGLCPPRNAPPKCSSRSSRPTSSSTGS